MFAQINIRQEGFKTKSVIRGLKDCCVPLEIVDAFQREEMDEIPEEDKCNLHFDLAGTGVIKREGKKLFIYGKKAFDPDLYQTKTIIETEKLYKGYELLVCDSSAVSLEKLREGNLNAAFRSYSNMINEAYNDVARAIGGIPYPDFDPNKNYMKNGVCDFVSKYSYGPYKQVL